MSHQLYEIRLLSSALTPLAQLWPVEGDVAPERIAWTRSWRDAGSLDLTIHRSTPWAAELLDLGTFLEVRREGAHEAIFQVMRAELTVGSVTYDRNALEHANVVYAAGQGEGTAREVVRRKDDAAIAEVGRLEQFRDRRDVDLGDLDRLRDEADADLTELAVTAFLAADVGKPRAAAEEVIRVTAVDPKWLLSRRVVIPPPATVNEGTSVVDISGSEHHTETGAADAVMKAYVDEHAINPAEAARVIPNLVNAGGSLSGIPSFTQQSRFTTVLETLQLVAQRADIGFDIVLSGTQLVFTPLAKTDKTASVRFRDSDVILDRDDQPYRDVWDIGDLITIQIEPLGITAEATIREVLVELTPATPPQMTVSLDRLHLREPEHLASIIKRGMRQATALL